VIHSRTVDRRGFRTGPLALLASAALAGCVSPSAEAPPVATAAPAVVLTGLDGVIGSNARGLVAQFGRPDLELSEGPTHKLQFLSAACVLDAYLLPPRSGAEPVVVHVDARLPDGREMDRASCVAALGARTRAP
jgi:hypothetical protein